jgi:uncharacterized membrane protein (DUF485 family)
VIESEYSVEIALGGIVVFAYIISYIVIARSQERLERRIAEILTK